MIDKTKPMKFVCATQEQVDKVCRILEAEGYDLRQNYGDGLTVFAYILDDDPCYDIARHDKWRTSLDVPFEDVDAQTLVAQYTASVASVGREVSVEEAMNIMAAAGGTRVENRVHIGDDVINMAMSDSTVPVNASDILQEAADALNNRAAERDHEDGSERSMERCVASFNAMRGHDLSVEDGWLFMVFLKLARSTNGAFRQDDYTDGAAYIALAGEEASK